MASTTPEERQRQRDVAAVASAAAAAAAAKPSAKTERGVALAAAKLPSAGARAAAAAAIIGSLVAYFAAQAPVLRQRLVDTLRGRAGVTPDDIIAAADQEVRFGAAFEKAARERMQRDLALVLAIPDPAAREKAIRGLMSREEAYVRMRSEAMFARAVAAVDRAVLRRESPNGAFWQLDTSVQEHTAGCLILGGRFWPWKVLDRVHPPRHRGCPCRLRGYGDAIAEGLLKPGDVMDTAAAVRAASGVLMEADAADDVTQQLVAELVARDLLPADVL